MIMEESHAKNPVLVSSNDSLGTPDVVYYSQLLMININTATISSHPCRVGILYRPTVPNNVHFAIQRTNMNNLDTGLYGTSNKTTINMHMHSILW